ADGVPLFIEELTKTVLERGQLRTQGGRQAPTESLSADIVPTSLQASLMARLDRLGAGKEVAQIGSVVGREFSFEMAVVLGGSPVERMQEALNQIVRAGLGSAGGEPPDIVYSFKHALVQDAAYASMLRDRRRDLHLRLADALERGAIRGIVPEPQLVAWHFGEAGVAEKSVDYYLKAAKQTTGRYALAEMVSQLRKGLRQLEHLPESESKLRRELDLQIALGRALIDYRGSSSDEVRSAFERGYELCRTLDDTERLVAAFDGLVLNYHFARSDSAKMLAYGEELLEVGLRTENPLALLWSRRARLSANFLQGRFEAARRDMQAVIGMYESRGEAFQHRWMAGDQRVSTSSALGICLTALGHLDSGGAMTLAGIKHAETLNHVVSLMTGLRRACVRGIMLRDVRGVLDLSNRLGVLNTEHETFVGVRESAIFQGWAQLHGNRDAGLFNQIQSAIEELHARAHWVLLPFLMTATAEVMGDNGDNGAAAALLDRAADLVDHTGEQWCEPEIIRLKARFGANNPDDAAAQLQEALAAARPQDAKLWELRAGLSLAEIWDNQGRREAARELLEPIYGWFSGGWTAPDLVAARTLLARLGAGIEFDGLTRRDAAPTQRARARSSGGRASDF